MKSYLTAALWRVLALAASFCCHQSLAGNATLWQVTDATGRSYPLLPVALYPAAMVTNGAGGFSLKDPVYSFTTDANGLSTMTNLDIGCYVASVSPTRGISNQVYFCITNANQTNFIVGVSAIPTNRPPGLSNSYTMAAADALFARLNGSGLGTGAQTISNTTLIEAGNNITLAQDPATGITVVTGTGGGSFSGNPTQFSGSSIKVSPIVTNIENIGTLVATNRISNGVNFQFGDIGGTGLLNYTSDTDTITLSMSLGGSLSLDNSGDVTAGAFIGDGSGITGINGVNITHGTVNSNALDAATAAQLALAGTGSASNILAGAGITVTPSAGSATVAVDATVVRTNGTGQSIVPGIAGIGSWSGMPLAGGIGTPSQPLWIFGGNATDAKTNNIGGDWGPQISSPGARSALSFAYTDINTNRLGVGTTVVLVDGNGQNHYGGANGYNWGSITIENGSGVPLNGIGAFQIVNNCQGPIVISQSYPVGGIFGDYEYFAVSNGITHFTLFEPGKIGIAGPTNSLDAMVITNEQDLAGGGSVGIYSNLNVGSKITFKGNLTALSSNGFATFIANQGSPVINLSYDSGSGAVGGGGVIITKSGTTGTQTDKEIGWFDSNGLITHTESSSGGNGFNVFRLWGTMNLGWKTDGGGDIGSVDGATSFTGRPNNVYVKTLMQSGSANIVTANAGSLNVTNTATAGLFSGSGASLTSIPQSAITGLNTNIFVGTNDSRGFTNSGSVTLSNPLNTLSGNGAGITNYIPFTLSAATNFSLVFNGTLQQETFTNAVGVTFSGIAGASGSWSCYLSNTVPVAYPAAVVWLTPHPTKVTNGVISFSQYGLVCVGAYKESQ